MKPRLIVHVGANKTGSSAVQSFLALNRRDLREHGIIVPDEQLGLREQAGGAHVFTFQQLLEDRAEGRARLATALTRIAEQEPQAKAVVLSAENLTANPAAPALFEGLDETFRLEIIMYIRRQDDFLLSSWQQWNSKIESDFWAWAVTNVGLLGNWRTHLEAWEKVVPRQQITVRVFEKGSLEGGDVVSDFTQLLGIDVPVERWQRPVETVNPSFSDSVMELVQGNPLVFDNVHDNDFYDFVRRFTGDVYLKDRRESSVTFRQRMAVLNRYRSSNDWVLTHYVGDNRGELFTPPGEADYIEVDPGKRDAEKLRFLTTVLYRMYRESK